jgi:hypothetical protein
MTLIYHAFRGAPAGADVVANLAPRLGSEEQPHAAPVLVPVRDVEKDAHTIVPIFDLCDAIHGNVFDLKRLCRFEPLDYRPCHLRAPNRELSPWGSVRSPDDCSKRHKSQCVNESVKRAVTASPSFPRGLLVRRVIQPAPRLLRLGAIQPSESAYATPPLERGRQLKRPGRGADPSTGTSVLTTACRAAAFFGRAA